MGAFFTLAVEPIALVDTVGECPTATVVDETLVAVTLGKWGTDAVVHCCSVVTLAPGANTLVDTGPVDTTAPIVDQTLVPIATSSTIAIEAILAGALEGGTRVDTGGIGVAVMVSSCTLVRSTRR